jgi:hypothetical protein
MGVYLDDELAKSENKINIILGKDSPEAKVFAQSYVLFKINKAILEGEILAILAHHLPQKKLNYSDLNLPFSTLIANGKINPSTDLKIISDALLEHEAKKADTFFQSRMDAPLLAKILLSSPNSIIFAPVGGAHVIEILKSLSQRINLVKSEQNFPFAPTRIINFINN